MIGAIKNLYKRFLNYSITKKFTIVFFFIFVVPAFIMIVMVNILQVSNTLDSYDKWASAKIDQVYYNAVNDREAMEKIAAQIILDNNLQYFMSSKTITDAEWADFLWFYKKNIVSLQTAYYQLIYKIRLFSNNFDPGINYQYVYSLDSLMAVLKSDVLPEGEEPFRGDVRKVVPGSGSTAGEMKPVIPYFYKVYSPYDQGELLGVVEIDVFIDKLFNYQDINLDEDYAYMVLDTENTVLYGKNAETMQYQIKPEELTENQGIFQLDDKYIAYERFDDIGISVFIGANESEIAEILKGQRTLLIWLMFFSSVVVILLVWMVINMMFKRLKNLVKIIESIEEGEFNQHLEDHGNDEISIIVRRFDEMSRKLKENIETAIQKETAQKEAQLKALQLQINPHFMYNVLENLRMQCEINGDSGMADTLISLADFFRYSIKDDNEVVTLETELKHLENYMAIMKFRYQDKLVFTQRIDEGCSRCMIPKVSLQPIVENCFRHAFANKVPPWELSISTHVSDGKMRICIKDNGQGIGAGDLYQLNEDLSQNRISLHSPAEGSPIGLHNVNTRIKMLFGPEFGVSLISRINVGTEVHIILPVSTEKKEAIA